MVNEKAFSKTNIFLYFNKKDLFENVLRRIPMKNCFPDYEGGDNIHVAMEFLKSQFEKRLPAGRTLAGFHFVSARDKKDIKASFQEVKQVMTKKDASTIAKVVDLLGDKEKERRESQATQVQAGILCCLCPFLVLDLIRHASSLVWLLLNMCFTA